MKNCLIFSFFFALVAAAFYSYAESPRTGIFFLTPEKYPPTEYVAVIKLWPMKEYIVIAEIEATTEKDDKIFAVSGGDPVKALVERAKTIGADAIILLEDRSFTRDRKSIRSVKAEAIRYKEREDMSEK